MSADENVQTAGSALAPVGNRLGELGILRVLLFGSRTRADFKSGSDWDFMVEFSRPITPNELKSLRETLALAMGSSVSVTSPQYSPPDFVAMVLPKCHPVWSSHV